MYRKQLVLKPIYHLSFATNVSKLLSIQRLNILSLRTHTIGQLDLFLDSLLSGKSFSGMPS